MNLETIIDLVLCHNHKLVPSMVQYMPCHNKIPLHLKRKISINDEAGIPQCEICYGSRVVLVERIWPSERSIFVGYGDGTKG